MLTRDNEQLEIFDNFQTDWNLPKHKKEKMPDESEQSGKFVISPSDAQSSFDGFNETNDEWAVRMPRNIATGGGGFVTVSEQKLSFRDRIIYWITRIRKAPKPKLSVKDFFEHVKSNLEDPQLYVDKVNEFLKVAKHAKDNGQVALFEKIMADINIIKQEAVLLSSGFQTSITEEQIVKFYKDSEKGLSLHYVKNFTRLIPAEVTAQKVKADQLKVFDNYVVLHYDKDAKAFQMTKAEIEKKKDPILFGVISGVRKLYYIADWVDEHCDLTLKQLIDKFGEDAIKANDITVKYNHKKHEE